jgi:hypothetical protein
VPVLLRISAPRDDAVHVFLRRHDQHDGYEHQQRRHLPLLKGGRQHSLIPQMQVTCG